MSKGEVLYWLSTTGLSAHLQLAVKMDEQFDPLFHEKSDCPVIVNIILLYTADSQLG